MITDQRNPNYPSPIFSILTVVRNSEKYLQRTIDSVTNQRFRDFEFIVVDGASTDRTMEIIKNNIDKIDCVLSEPDSGLVNGYNKALSLSRGSIIGFLNGDDAYFANTLELVFSKIPNDEQHFVIYGGIDNFDQSKPTLFTSASNLKRSMIPHPSMFISRACFEKHGQFDETFRVAADYDLTARLYTQGVDFIEIESPLSIYQDGGISFKLLDVSLKETLLIRKKYFNEHFVYRLIFRLKVKLMSRIHRMLKTT